MQKSGNGVRHHNYEAIVAWAEGKMISLSTDGGNSWENYDKNFGFTPLFGDPLVMFRVGRVPTPAELKGIHQGEILAYLDKDCAENLRNYLLVKLSDDDGSDMPLCKVVVGNKCYVAGETTWCDLDNLTKVFPSP